MENILIYLARSFFCLGALYIVWWLFMSKDTFFTVNRFYLTSSVFLSLILPLFDFSTVTNFSRISATVMMQAVTIKPEEIQNIYSSNLSLFQVIVVVYLTGVVIFFIRFLIQIFQLLRLIKQYGISKKEGLKFVFTDSNYAPFSFFGLIFLNSKFNEQDIEKIILHESVHINQWHSFDLLLLEILTILQWYNPFTWLYRRSLKSIHEYLADEGVLLKGIDRFNYQELLLSISLGIQVNDLTNNIHKSLIKRRFFMMFKEKSNINSSLKYFLILPVALFLLFTFGMNDSTLKAFSFDVKDSVYTNLEIMPEYAGGVKALQQFIISNVKYPEECRKNKIEGTVAIDFIVRKTGKIDNITVAKSQSGKEALIENPEFEKEAVRVISLMPDWIPGKVNNKPVDAKISIPFRFKLQ
jgi:TonB family protein